MTDITIDAMRWHQICYELKLDDGASTRTKAFEDVFNCKVTWKSRLEQWPGDDVSARPNPVMVLSFWNPNDATLFALRWS